MAQEPRPAPGPSQPPRPGGPKAGFAAMFAAGVVIGFAVVWKALPRKRAAA